MDGLLKGKNANDPVYVFLDKKRKEGKPYYTMSIWLPEQINFSEFTSDVSENF